MIKQTNFNNSPEVHRSGNPIRIPLRIITWISIALSGLMVFFQCEGDRTSPSEKVLGEKPQAPAPEVVLNRSFHPLLLQDGRLMGLFVDTLGDGRYGIKSMISKDHGRSWAEPDVMYELSSASEGDAWADLVGILDKDNRLQVFLLKWRGKYAPGSHLDVWHTRSEYPWNKWEDPKRVFIGYVGALMSAIQMNNGRILTSFELDTDRSYRTPDKGLAGYIYMGHFSCTTIYSDDGGETFQQSPDTLSLPASTLSTYGGNEPVVIELADGRVWMMIRTQLGRYYESFSTDGIRWSNPKPSRFIASDSPVSLTRLQDNQIVMLWNACQRYPYAFGGRHVLHGAISSDEAVTWQGFREVYRDPHRKEPAHPIGADYGTAYSFCAPTGDGKMVFSTGQGASAMTFSLDPEWLKVKSQFEDFSQGLEAWSVFGTRGVELVNHPVEENTRVLRIQRTDLEFPAGAVWNFPGGKKGEVRIRMLVESESGGFSLSLTDHFSTPFDQEADLNALFVVPVNTVLGLTDGVECEPGIWHEIKLSWDFETNQGRVVIDDKKIKDIPQLRIISQGVNYLRIRSLENSPQKGGLLLESVYSKINKP